MSFAQLAKLEEFVFTKMAETKLPGLSAAIVKGDKVGIGTDWGAVYPEPLLARLNEEVKRIGFREEHNVDWSTVTEGFKDWRDWPNITYGLVSRGYSDTEIKGILGGNFLNIFREVVGYNT